MENSHASRSGKQPLGANCAVRRHTRLPDQRYVRLSLTKFVQPNDGARTAPVSHQKRPRQNATNTINLQRKFSKINETDHYPVAHNGLVVGSSPAGVSSLTQ